MKKVILLLLALLASSPALAGVSCSLPFNLQNNQIADATQVMANYNALVTCLGNAAAAGVNSDITQLTALNIPLTPTQGGSSVYIGGTSTGVANAQIVAAPSPIGFTLTNGYQVVFQSGFTNTGATTLNVNSTGATAVKIETPNGTQALVGGEIQANQLVHVVYSSQDSSFHLRDSPTMLGGFGPVSSIASSTTTDLSTATSHNANISGVTTITSFGSNANVNFPIYRVCFAGSLTLTYNATSLILPGAANVITAANDCAVAMYLGSGNWQVIQYTRASSPVTITPLCGFNGLSIKNNSGTPNTNIDVSASSSVMINPTGNAPFFVTSPSFTINLTTGTVTSAANGMDGEARPTSGWVYLYMIYNGTTTAGLGSTNTTTPTLPSGYTSYCRMGAMLTDGSANLLRSLQKGREAQYTVTAATNTAALPNIANGTAGTYSGTAPVWVTPSITAFVPATATKIVIVATSTWNNNAGANLSVAPNSGYAGPSSTNPPPVSILGVTASAKLDMVLEGTTIAWSSSGAGGGISASGWVDAVNAN